MSGTNHGFHLMFNLVTGMSPQNQYLMRANVLQTQGSTGGFNPNDRDRDIPFSAKDEPATLPRVQDLIIITESSPWCTVVHNDRGVTMGDVCSTIWKE